MLNNDLFIETSKMLFDVKQFYYHTEAIALQRVFWGQERMNTRKQEHIVSRVRSVS
jgi:hypothetical protein